LSRHAATEDDLINPSGLQKQEFNNRVELFEAKTRIPVKAMKCATWRGHMGQ
jgi:hypothetical protein